MDNSGKMYLGMYFHKNFGSRNEPVQLGCCQTVSCSVCSQFAVVIPCGLAFFCAFDETVRNEIFDFHGVLFLPVQKARCIVRLCPVFECEVGNYVSGGNTKIMQCLDMQYSTGRKEFFPVRT